MTGLRLARAAMSALAAASLAACNQAAKPPVDTGKIADAIKADAAQRIADVNAYDAAKLASHDAADAVSMFHGRPNAVGPAAIQAGFQQSLAAVPGLHVTLSDQTVDVGAAGDMAVFRATATATFTDPTTKKPVTTTNNDLQGYKLQPDGSWKIEWSVVSDVAPPPAAAPAAPAAKS